MKAMTFAELDSRSEKIGDLMISPRFVAQQKMDGVRVLAHLGPQEGPIYRQRTGEPLKFAAAAQHLRKISRNLPVFVMPVILDGELMIETGEYRLFDLIFPEQLDMPYWNRLHLLHQVVTTNDVIKLVKSFQSEQEKLALFGSVYSGGGEGIMLKNLDSAYLPGLRTSEVMKVKFVKSAEVIVLEVNKPDPKHGSATLGVYVDGTTSMKAVGGCSLIGKPEVKPGDVIEVAYLYYTGSNLYQPRMSRVLVDRLPEDCTTAQFKPYSREVFS